MELYLAFYPSLAIGVCLLILVEARREFNDNWRRMYELGKKHGREEAGIDVYSLALRLYNKLPAQEDSHE